MKCSISKYLAFKIMEWICFIGFIIVAGCFASGVLEQFFSRKTSFSQKEEEVFNYPVISIVFNGYQASEINLTNVKLTYYAEMKNRQTVVSERDICKQNELAKMNTNL